MMRRVLFVCLGNICRSPLAKWIFLDQVKRSGDAFGADSCGIGSWHEGGPADERSIRLAKRRRLVPEHVARQVSPQTDFAGFDLLVGMDRANLDALRRLGAPKPRVVLVRAFDPAFVGREPPEVPDPYQGSERDFERVYDMLVPACAGLIEHLRGMR